jgi:phosphoglycerate dehydrogenase-like enzyme
MPLTIVALNVASQDTAFDPLRALGDIEVVHAEYRTSWEEVSARRTGTTAKTPEVISDELRAVLQRADVIFAFVVPRDLFALAPRVRWVATPATGVDHMRGTGVLESDIILTTVGGHFAPVIAEHVFTGILHFAKRLTAFEQQQRDHVWKMTRVQTLAGRMLGVVGVGAIGVAVAKLAHTFNMQVVGIGRGDPRGRQIPHVDRLLSRELLPELLAAADYVVVAVADTPETRHMIGAVELAAMPPHAVLVNVARGTVIDEVALITALRDGRIAGAMLDVVAHEPLSADSPLWDLPNVLLTPHVATSIVEYLPQAITLFTDNVRRFLRGEPLLHQFDRTRGY